MPRRADEDEWKTKKTAETKKMVPMSDTIADACRSRLTDGTSRAKGEFAKIYVDRCVIVVYFANEARGP